MLLKLFAGTFALVIALCAAAYPFLSGKPTTSFSAAPMQLGVGDTIRTPLAETLEDLQRWYAMQPRYAFGVGGGPRAAQFDFYEPGNAKESLEYRVSGRILMAEPRCAVRVLSESGKACQVEILSGRYAGRQGWVRRDEVVAPGTRPAFEHAFGNGFG